MQTVYELEMENCQEMIDYGSGHEIAAATRQKDKLVKWLKDCREYDALVVHIAIFQINIELDEGVKVKCRKTQTGADGRFCETWQIPRILWPKRNNCSWADCAFKERTINEADWD